MKNFSKYLVAIIVANLLEQYVCVAQITLDTIIPTTYTGIGPGFRSVQIGPDETKWYFQDTVSNTFSLYNMDFTPFLLNIAVPEPFRPTTIGFNALYITRALFDCDTSNIEYAYTAPVYGSKPFRIVRTDGTILFQLDSANGPYVYGGEMGGESEIRPIINTSSGTKLLLKKNTPAGGPEPIYVYSLCGSLPAEMILEGPDINKMYVKVFPNPSSMSVTFEINPPDNMNEYALVIVDNNANEIKQEKVIGRNSYYLDAADLSNGTYIYSLCSKNKSFQSGKFIIIK